MKNDTLHAFYNTKITGGFWRQKQDLIENTTIHAVWNRFADTGRFDAIHCDWREGQKNKPHIFWDSDVAKWMESAAYILEEKEDKDLETKVDMLIDRYADHQWLDGYMNSYYTTVCPSKRFTDISNHELYCAGHLMEAAVAYYHAAGKRKFLDCMCKYADLIEQIFVKEKSAKFAVPGHEEIELALFRLYHTTGEERYKELAKHFLEARCPENAQNKENCQNAGLLQDGPEYLQCHKPIREQTVPAGHAVRANYLYCGMADEALEYQDESLAETCKQLFRNTVDQQMYITGGIGASKYREAFSMSYDLPNMDAYNETCAALSLALFARRMSLIDTDSIYADTVERIIYNGFLSGLSLDGKHFFYENPLEFDAKLLERCAVRDGWQKMAITKRVEVFYCSCCPPNITRFIMSIGDFLYSYNKDCIFVHQFMESETEVCGVKITQKTNYPTTGSVTFTTDAAKACKLAIRLPGWCNRATLTVDGKETAVSKENGYFILSLEQGKHTVNYTMDMEVTVMEAHPNVQEDAGRVAVMYGPIVYCLESVDNGNNLRDVILKSDSKFNLVFHDAMNAWTIQAEGLRRDPDAYSALYRPVTGKYIPQPLTFIPYFAFANRDADEMLVWVQYR